MDLKSIREAEVGATLWDTSVKGLHLRVLSNKKAFYLFYRPKNGGQRRPKIGDVTEISLADARRRAKGILDQVAMGSDPKAQWDESKKEQTVEDLYDKAWKDIWSKDRFKLSGYSKEVKSKWNAHLKSAFGKYKISDVTLAKVREWHKSLEEKPITANRGLSVLSRLFSYAEELELRSQGTNPCKYVVKFQEKERKRYATEEEMRRIFEVLEREEKQNPISVAHLKLLIYTGSRPRAIERARWEDLEVFQLNGEKYGILTFFGKSTAKTGQQEVVALPPQAMDVLDSIPKNLGGTLTGIKLPSKLWAKIRKEAGVDDLWARDFRRLFATVGMSNGVTSGQIMELLNHHSVQTTKRYAKLMHNSRVQAAMQIASKIDEMTQSCNNVIEIESRKQ